MSAGRQSDPEEATGREVFSAMRSPDSVFVGGRRPLRAGATESQSQASGDLSPRQPAQPIELLHLDALFVGRPTLVER
jgi:hypothetical protein